MAETTDQYRTRINQIKKSVEEEPAIRKMRDDIAEGLGKTGNRQADIEDQFQSVIDETTGRDVISAPEILVARNGEANLNARLLKKEQEFEIEMAMNMLNDEQLRAYVDLLQQQVTSMGDISPEPFETYEALVTANPPHTGVYVVTADGNWYYWNSISIQWSFGGKYQASGIADKSLTSLKYGDKSIQNNALSDQFSYKKQLGNTDNLNTIFSEGNYLIIGKPINSPTDIGTSSTLKVGQLAGRWITQEITNLTYPHKVFKKVLDNTNAQLSKWVEVTNIANDKYLTSANDLNNYLTTGKWIAIDPINAPQKGTFALEVEQFFTSYTSGAYWIKQTLTDINTNYVKFERVISFSQSTGLIVRPFKQLDNEESQTLKGKVVLNLADSIYGNTQGVESVSAHIANRTGATVHNLGFGGTRIAQHNQYWDAFSLYRLADEIIKPNTDSTKWQLQDEAISAIEAGLVVGMPSYFKQSLALLKSIDFTTVDYITIASGTNDLPVSGLDNTQNKYDITSMGGALRYSLEKIMTNFKQLKIMVCSPIYRFWMDESGAFIDDSDTREYNGLTLIDFVEKQREIAKEFKTPFSDNYFELGFNKFNKELYYPPTDGTHPNATGNKRLGNKTGTDLINSF